MSLDVTQKQSLLHFLRTHDTAAIATVKKDGVHVATVFCFANDDLHLYVLTKYNTVKFDNLAVNGNIGLVLTDEKAMQTVQMEGVAKEVDYGNEFAPIAENLLRIW